MFNKKMLTGLALVLSMIFAMSATAAPKKWSWDDEEPTDPPAEEPTDPVDPPAGEGSVMSVYCIDWTPTGGKDQHPHVQIAIVDENGNAVEGAEVLINRYLDGEVHKLNFGGSTSTDGGLDDGVDCPNGPLGSGFTADFCINNAPTGYYDVDVISVTKDGMTWDGVSPSAGAGYDHVAP